jgi:hypothetical protein
MLEMILSTSASTPGRKFFLLESVCVTPITETFGAALPDCFAYASSSDPSVAV